MSVGRRACLSVLAVAAAVLATESPARAYLSFDPEQIVTAGGVEIDVPGYSVPSMADWNSDGLPDLVVGEGTTEGKVRVYLNDGSPGSPHFSSFSYAQSMGSDLAVLGGG